MNSLNTRAATSTRLLFAAVMLAPFLASQVWAANLCVNPGGSSGCYSTLSAAVTAAAPGDTIRVAPGVYAGDIVIGKPLSLIGANRSNTIINAAGQSNGIYIDGIDNPGIGEVTVSGFAVENANFEGILVANASNVTVSGNKIEHNNKNLSNATTCPGIPTFETLEGFDCGEGIHLTGVDHSTVSNNLVDQNAGGILLSDDTGATHDNLITGNVVHNNPYDCGITLASHPPAPFTGAIAPLGVFHNTIAGNDSSYNGLAVEGAGAGVGIFDSVPGTKNYGNVVINNRMIGNGLPGVAMHGHAPGQNLNDNVIAGNYIAGNHADTEDAATPGPTGINIMSVSPITGTVVAQNTIKDEAVDLAFKSSTTLDAHLNDFLGMNVGVANLGTGMINAAENWWGCGSGPGATGCSAVSGSGVVSTPWLMTPIQSNNAK